MGGEAVVRVGSNAYIIGWPRVAEQASTGRREFLSFFSWYVVHFYESGNHLNLAWKSSLEIHRS
jgi:hypothetical protein